MITKFLSLFCEITWEKLGKGAFKFKLKFSSIGNLGQIAKSSLVKFDFLNLFYNLQYLVSDFVHSVMQI